MIAPERGGAYVAVVASFGPGVPERARHGVDDDEPHGSVRPARGFLRIAARDASAFHSPSASSSDLTQEDVVEEPLSGASPGERGVLRRELAQARRGGAALRVHVHGRAAEAAEVSRELRREEELQAQLRLRGPGLARDLGERASGHPAAEKRVEDGAQRRALLVHRAREGKGLARRRREPGRETRRTERRPTRERPPWLAQGRGAHGGSESGGKGRFENRAPWKTDGCWRRRRSSSLRPSTRITPLDSLRSDALRAPFPALSPASPARAPAPRRHHPRWG